MKTTVTIKSPQGSIVTISVEHDEPMNISTDLEAIEQRADQVVSAQLNTLEVIDAGRSLTENPDSTLEIHDTSTGTERSRNDREEKPRCKWCGRSFEHKRNKNEKYCSDHCKHEAKKEKGRVYKRRINSLTNSHVAREYRGKNCSRCGRYYIPTGSRQDYCKPDCKPLTPAEHAELDATLKQIEANQKKPVI